MLIRIVGNQRLLRLAWLIVLIAALRLIPAVAGGRGEPEPETMVESFRFPEFFTPNDEYFVTRIGGIPDIDPGSYRLEISGLVDTPVSYTLEELYAMDLEELPLTVECIGNSQRGPLLSTAVWKGIRLKTLLESLGIVASATGVKYLAADGYYASHTLEQIEDNGVMIALYMNGVPIPPVQGFPVRVLNPGYYGVKQPAWVTGIEVIDRDPEDYWGDRGWDVSPPMAIDSTIFSPSERSSVTVGEEVRVTGAAFGGRRVSRVEVTIDYGESWKDAEIVESIDADNVWVFWETTVIFERKGTYIINSRATDIDGNVQQEDDTTSLNGNNDWPVVRLTVK